MYPLELLSVDLLTIQFLPTKTCHTRHAIQQIQDTVEQTPGTKLKILSIKFFVCIVDTFTNLQMMRMIFLTCIEKTFITCLIT